MRDITDAERKATMLAEADAALDDARLLGDLVVGAALAQRDDADPLAATTVARNARRLMLDARRPCGTTARWHGRSCATLPTTGWSRRAARSARSRSG